MQIIQKITNDLSDVKYFAQKKIKWSYNLEKAPWWGSVYEQNVKSLKRCLKTAIGRVKLSYDEFLTVVTEAGMILNCRPISCLF